MVLSSWRGHCESSHGSLDECRPSTRWPPTLKPSQLTWPVSLSVGCYHPHPPSPFISITQLILIYHPTENRRLCSPCTRLYITLAVVISTTARGEIRTWVPSSQPCTTRPLRPAETCNHVGQAVEMFVIVTPLS